jgi:pSer/pThr/pTyr-binding forkhead associated (FHA) protein
MAKSQPRSASAVARLVFTEGDRANTVFPLFLKETLVGRIDSADLLLEDFTVSRLHARFILGDKDEVFLEDLDSREGTWVNSVGVKGPVLLKDGDKIAFGDVVVTFERG